MVYVRATAAESPWEENQLTYDCIFWIYHCIVNSLTVLLSSEAVWCACWSVIQINTLHSGSLKSAEAHMRAHTYTHMALFSAMFKIQKQISLSFCQSLKQQMSPLSVICLHAQWEHMTDEDWCSSISPQLWDYHCYMICDSNFWFAPPFSVNEMKVDIILCVLISWICNHFRNHGVVFAYIITRLKT